MKITLIGMSNTGKSFWSKQMERQLGFVRFDCDALVGGKLGIAGISNVAEWMGQPYEKRYAENSQTYLDYEREVMREVLMQAEILPKSSNVVIDTTGSVIYTGDEIMSALKYSTTVAYLDTPQSVQDEMFAKYIAEPKPVIWGESFVRQAEEPVQATLKRCYPQLLAFRTGQYKRWAGVV